MKQPRPAASAVPCHAPLAAVAPRPWRLGGHPSPRSEKALHPHQRRAHSTLAGVAGARGVLAASALALRASGRCERRNGRGVGLRRGGTGGVEAVVEAVVTAEPVNAADRRHVALGADPEGAATDRQLGRQLVAAGGSVLDIPDGGALSIVEQLYAGFNRCDPDMTANCFTEDVVYEDLLLGNTTIVSSREEFRELINTHPVFVGSRFCTALKIPPLDVAVRVDSIAEDTSRGTVGVEWHVEVGGQPLVLGRGLSFMRICPQTGLIRRAVDIAEAPWRAIGLFVAPFARGLRDFSRAIRDWGTISIIAMVLFVLLFVDRSSLDEIRTDIDSLDDFRDELDRSTFRWVQDLQRTLGKAG